MIIICDMGTPASLASKSMQPRLADPAPWKRNVSFFNSPIRSSHDGFFNLIAPRMPATATDAVPWMSSLYVRNLSRYSASRGNASFELKSSN